MQLDSAKNSDTAYQPNSHLKVENAKIRNGSLLCNDGLHRRDGCLAAGCDGLPMRNCLLQPAHFTTLPNKRSGIFNFLAQCGHAIS